MKTYLLDSALYYKRKSSVLIGLGAMYVEDSLFVGNVKYTKIYEETERNFEYKGGKWDRITFTGIKIESRGDGFTAHQKRIH